VKDDDDDDDDVTRNTLIWAYTFGVHSCCDRGPHVQYWSPVCNHMDSFFRFSITNFIQYQK